MLQLPLSMLKLMERAPLMLKLPIMNKCKLRSHKLQTLSKRPRRCRQRLIKLLPLQPQLSRQRLALRPKQRPKLKSSRLRKLNRTNKHLSNRPSFLSRTKKQRKNSRKKKVCQKQKDKSTQTLSVTRASRSSPVRRSTLRLRSSWSSRRKDQLPRLPKKVPRRFRIQLSSRNLTNN